MPLHLIKLAVGAETADDLAKRIAWRITEYGRVAVHTRQTPKRADEVLDGGSLYWVVKGQVMARQRILAIETLGERPAKHCEVVLDHQIVRTAPQPRRAFQGWRYFEAKDAPPDLEDGDEFAALPDFLARELRELGAW